jgi:signal transduction histidine kinase
VRWHLRERGRPALDAAAALAAGVFTVVMLHQGGLGGDSDGYRPLDLTGFLLAVASVAPLVWARRAPGAAFAVSAAATLALTPYPLDVPPGLLIATYMLAEAVGGGDTPRRRLWAAVSVAAFVPLTMILMLLDDTSLSSLSSGMVAWATMFALVWTAGDRSRLRRERITELELHARLRTLELQTQRRLVAAQERTRIARELHDSAGHAINVILVQAGAARLLHERDPKGSLRAIETIEDVAQSTIIDIDHLVRALREDSGPVAPAPADTSDLEQLVDRHRASGLEVSTRFDGAPRGLPSGVAWAAYRILQEALTNAARHGSGQADVRMSYGESAVEILVRNPVGDRNRPGGGMGLVGMRERVALLDGTLDVDGEGTGVFRLRARLPYRPPATVGAIA